MQHSFDIQWIMPLELPSIMVIYRFVRELCIHLVFVADIKRAVIFLYCVAEMWSEAVNIALNVKIVVYFACLNEYLKDMSDIQEGKRIAQWMDYGVGDIITTYDTHMCSTVSIETRRAIWLSIGNSMIVRMN